MVFDETETHTRNSGLFICDLYVAMSCVKTKDKNKTADKKNTCFLRARARVFLHSERICGIRFCVFGVIEFRASAMRCFSTVSRLIDI